MDKLADQWVLIRGARQLLTLNRRRGPRRGAEMADLGAIADGAALIHNGLIVAVGPTRRVENLAEARHARVIEASGQVVLPPFVDAHASIVPAAILGSDRLSPGRILSTVPVNRLKLQTQHLLKIAARHGTATVAALSGYGLDAPGEIKTLRVLAALHGKPLDLIPTLHFHGSESPAGVPRSGFLEPQAQLMEHVARRGLALATSYRCLPDGRLNDVCAFLEAARSCKLPARIEVPVKYPATSLSLAAENDAISVTVRGRIPEAEFDALARGNTIVVLLPSADGTGVVAMGRHLVDAGVPVAVASGLNPESGGMASMQAVLCQAIERLQLSIEEAICAATINAAWAAGAGDIAGSLEVGKSGDVLILNASDYRDIPLLSGTNLVHSMLKRGVLLFEEEFVGWPSLQD